MNILFLGLSTIKSFSDRGIYSDLLRELSKLGHKVFCVTTTERRNNQKTTLFEEPLGKLLIVRTFNIQKSSIIEKGLGTLLIPRQFNRAIKKYFRNINFDLIVYPTPPITLFSVVKNLKKKTGAKTYLMLKDIFPQNAVDLGMMKKTGLKGFIYNYFRSKEKKLYKVSDRIGCMSNANVEYLLGHNSEIPSNKVEVFPNCIDVQDLSLTQLEKDKIRIKYKLPLDKKIFVYGGNLGKPQNIPFLIECIKTQKENDSIFFLIAGNGTDYKKLVSFRDNEKQHNFKLLGRLPKNEYDRMIAACDVGMIFLDYNFTIPNFPSRLLSYMQAGIPVLACTDKVTDIGRTIVQGGFGWWCASNDVENFKSCVLQAMDDCFACRKKEKEYLEKHFSVKSNVSKIYSF